MKTFLDTVRALKNEEIARRYAIMNSFDGILTTFGIILAQFFANVSNPKLVIVSCIGAAIAMGVSGTWGAYFTEKAERKKKLREIERHLLRKLKDTKPEFKMKITTFLIAIVDGIAPLISSIIIIIPFILSLSGILSVEMAFYYAFFIIIVLLFIMGILIGKIAKENLILSGIKMILVGIVVGVIVYFIDSLEEL